MKKLTKEDLQKMDKHNLQELTLMCLAVMREKTGLDIRKIGEDAVKTPRIKKYLKDQMIDMIKEIKQVKVEYKDGTSEYFSIYCLKKFMIPDSQIKEWKK